MPCILRQVPLAGPTYQVLPVDFPAESLAEAARYEPANGVYGVFATWNGHRVVCLTRHLDRLEDSARRAGFELRLDRELLRAQLRHVLDQSGFAEARIRISAAPDRATLAVGMEPYEGPPVGLQREGVPCSTIAHAARNNPEAKQTGWLLERTAFAASDPYSAYEQLLVDESGAILEGGSSNFFVITHGDPRTDAAGMPADRTLSAAGPARRPVLLTANEGILPGIARSIALDVAKTIAPETLTIDLRPPRVDEITSFREAFLTSASRGILPVTSIDGVPVGAGRPGPATRMLIRLYKRRARELEEPL